MLSLKAQKSAFPDKPQEVSPFPAGDHKASTNIRALKHNKTRHNIIHKRSTALEQLVKIFYWRAYYGLTVHQPHPKFRCGLRHLDVWFARKTPNLSKHHLLEHINQDKKNEIKQR